MVWWVAGPSGRRKKHYSSAFPAEAQARHYRNKVERDDLSGLTTDYRGGNKLFGEYADKWLKSRLVKATLLPRRLCGSTQAFYGGTSCLRSTSCRYA